MTTKELLYVEDALGHLKYIQSKCSETSGQIQDSELRSFTHQLSERHREIFRSFYSLL